MFVERRYSIAQDRPITPDPFQLGHGIATPCRRSATLA
jgi:hypothetical protein